MEMLAVVSLLTESRRGVVRYAQHLAREEQNKKENGKRC